MPRSRNGAADWRQIATAPRDGSRILVVVRASEQWPAEVELARWARPRHAAEACWMAADTGPRSSTIFAEGELSHWMPLPEPPEEGEPVPGAVEDA